MPTYAFVPSLGNQNEATYFSPKIRKRSQAHRMLSALLFMLTVSVTSVFATSSGASDPRCDDAALKSDVLGEERTILVRTPRGMRMAVSVIQCST